MLSVYMVTSLDNVYVMLCRRKFGNNPSVNLHWTLNIHHSNWTGNKGSQTAYKGVPPYLQGLCSRRPCSCETWSLLMHYQALNITYNFAEKTEVTSSLLGSISAQQRLWTDDLPDARRQVWERPNLYRVHEYGPPQVQQYRLLKHYAEEFFYLYTSQSITPSLVSF